MDLSVRECSRAHTLLPHTHSVIVHPQRRYNLHNLKDEDFPQFRLFVRGYDPKAPLEYNGKPTAEEMSGWLVAEANIFLGKRVS